MDLQKAYCPASGGMTLETLDDNDTYFSFPGLRCLSALSLLFS